MWCSEPALSSIIYSEGSRRACVHSSDKCALRSPEHRFGRNLLPTPKNLRLEEPVELRWMVINFIVIVLNRPLA
jgi:hypothetical protein